MPTPAITASTRYFLPGTTKVYILPAVASMTVGPTRAELTAGLDISEEIAAINGWQISSDNVPTADLGKRFVPQVSGRLNASDSGLTCWADVTGADIRAELVIDQETFVVFLDGGDVEDSPMDVYKAKVSSVGKPREIEGAGRIDVKFSIRAFAENLTVPAAA
jgi:hypothetical protein